MTPALSGCGTWFIIIASVFFLVVALAHVVRLAKGWTIQIGPIRVPHWISIFGAVVSAFLAVWGISLVFMH